MRKELFRGIKYCIRCCMPETHRNSNYDELGLCRGCRSSEQKMHINWVEREKLLSKFFQEAKEKAGNNYDCLLPISGGKDSMFQAHVLVKVYNMKPLAVTHNHNWYSEVGWYNLMNLLEVFNIDHIMFTPNRSLVNRLAKRSLYKIGDACWHCHSGAGAFPWQVAVNFNIPLLVYGESTAESHGRSSYLEKALTHDRNYYNTVSAGLVPGEMVGDGITSKDVNPYLLPSQEECEKVGAVGIHLGDFMFWDHERQTEFVRDTYGWLETDIEGSYKHYKSAECIMPGVHDFTCYLKRGYARATAESTFDVRNGMMSRAEAKDMIAATDPVRPHVLDYYKEITGLDEEEIYSVMEGHREPQLKGTNVPTFPKDRPHGPSLLPFPIQLIERLRKNDKPFYETDQWIEGEFLDKNPALSYDEFANLSAKQIIDGYTNKEFSPLDIAKACISRIEKLDPFVHAFETFDPDFLIKQASEVQQKLITGQYCRLLEGVPVGIKDIYNTKELPTQMGSPIWKGFTPGNDARAVFNIIRAGGIIAGKTVTAEFAVHALGKTLNPHDSERNPGTSSSGSAVAVATGMVPVALGSQTAGSISRPASYCGVYGYKPSFGLIPRTGTLKTTDSLDTLGFLCAHFEDMVCIFHTLRVHGHNYPISHAALNNKNRQLKPDNRPWKVALLRTHTWKYATSYSQESLIKWVNELSKNPEIEITEIDLPETMIRTHEIHSTIYDRTLSYYFKEEGIQKENVSPVIYEIIKRGESITPDQYRKALEDQEELTEAMDLIMADFDAGISLSTAGHALLRNQEEPPDPSLVWTLMHLPTLSAPVFQSSTGLPFGAQLVARKYNDYLLFNFASYLRNCDYIPEKQYPMVNESLFKN